MGKKLKTLALGAALAIGVSGTALAQAYAPNNPVSARRPVHRPARHKAAQLPVRSAQSSAALLAPRPAPCPVQQT